MWEKGPIQPSADQPVQGYTYRFTAGHLMKQSGSVNVESFPTGPHARAKESQVQHSFITLHTQLPFPLPHKAAFCRHPTVDFHLSFIKL